jgi:N-methylhydantoinase A
MRVATDIGGTFTDLIYLDEATGEVGLTKASTTPHNFAIGVEDTLKKSGINVADTTFFVHGSTIIINALTERKGVKMGLVQRNRRDSGEGLRCDRRSEHLGSHWGHERAG